MKKQLLFLIAFTIIAVTTIFFISSYKVDVSVQQRPKTMAMTASIEIPDKMVYAGEVYAFDRYDMHEKLDRELNSFTYFHSHRYEFGSE